MLQRRLVGVIEPEALKMVTPRRYCPRDGELLRRNYEGDGGDFGGRRPVLACEYCGRLYESAADGNLLLLKAESRANRKSRKANRKSRKGYLWRKPRRRRFTKA